MYNRYKDIRGEAAKEFSHALGIDGPSSIPDTGYLVEIRTASDHFRLSAHGQMLSREALIYKNGSLTVIELDDDAGEARKTVYDKGSGTITSLRARWSVKANGYQSDYEQVEELTGKQEAIDSEWRRLNDVLTLACVAANVRKRGF